MNKVGTGNQERAYHGGPPVQLKSDRKGRPECLLDNKLNYGTVCFLPMLISCLYCARMSILSLSCWLDCSATVRSSSTSFTHGTTASVWYRSNLESNRALGQTVTYSTGLETCRVIRCFFINRATSLHSSSSFSQNMTPDEISYISSIDYYI